MFYYSFFSSKVLYLLSQVKITLNIYIFTFLKDIFVVLQPYIFLGGFFLNYFDKKNKLRFGRFKVWFGTKAAKMSDFGHLNVMFG